MVCIHDRDAIRIFLEDDKLKALLDKISAKRPSHPAITADNIILDGAGHKITGNQTGDGVFASGRANVTIRNLNVTNFSYGVYLDAVSDSLVYNNTVVSNTKSGVSFLSGSSLLLQF